jgi:hypothetical protein
MSLLKALGLGKARDKTESAFVERRAEHRRAVFQEAMLLLDYENIRVVITDLSSRGARVQFSARTELPFRVRLMAQTLKLNCGARVVWQNDGAAGLEFLAKD